ncbi:MAG: hypothetical protein ABW095_04900 [Candidatus Thiodiazotropha sp.]
MAIDKPDLVIEEMVERKLPYIPDPIAELNLRYDALEPSDLKRITPAE